MPKKKDKKDKKDNLDKELTGYKKGTTKAKGKLHILEDKYGFVPMHKYHSNIVPKGKHSVLEK